MGQTNNNNKANILEIIKNYGPISIKDVARLCSLSIPSATAVIDLFLEDGLLMEETSTENISGRRPKLIHINPAYGFIVGIDLGIFDYANVGFFDMCGALIVKRMIGLHSSGGGSEILHHIIDIIKNTIDNFAGKHGKLCNIVIGNPGIVNPKTGALTLAASSVSWTDFPLNQLFMKEFDVETITLNDINLSAIGEKMFGAGRGYQNSIFVRIDIGLKAGIIINNALYGGENDAAGEIGNNVIIYKNPITGEMYSTKAETLLTLNSIIKRISDELPNHPDDILYALTGADKSDVGIDNILKALVYKNSYVCDIINEAGLILGYVLSNMATTLDIDLIIIGGDIVKLHNYIFKPMREAIASVISPAPTISTSILGEDVALWGAASVGLEHVMQKLKGTII